MINLLLVEDDDPKLDQVVYFLENLPSQLQVTVAKSLNSACNLIDREYFDIILLDMSLPTFDGRKTAGSNGRQKTFGGKEVLMYLWELEIDTPVYVITGFKDFPGEFGQVLLPQLHAELTDEFPANYKGNIYFTHSSDDWKLQLRNLLEK
ncbi:response regulator [Rugamonas sp. FT107W]|uniref:Response regulator n=1 Tax=Duganella vulcania TaxID=2692166 RepID=A0A845HGS5_9BURK|nr:response regulator [Duganella vulcania]MYN18492.1 response regulator [Duganella vulcania]